MQRSSIRKAMLGLTMGLLAAAALAARPVPVPELHGTVSRVIDGDTLWVTPAGGGEVQVVRIDGIDAPERCQAWGTEATAALGDIALGKNVTVRGRSRDEYGRLIGKLLRDGEFDVGDRLVRDGHAWSARYRHDRGPYVAEERLARALSRGLHAGGGAIQPREFRKRHGPCEATAGTPTTTPPSTSSAPLPKVSPLPNAASLSRAAFRCDGRLYCSQMRSCEEATWFLQHCPDVKMDGNADGVPCERQWCRR